MKLTEAEFSSQVEKMKGIAARSLDSCLVAHLIAISDERVRKLSFKSSSRIIYLKVFPA